MKKISLGGVALVCAFCSYMLKTRVNRNYFYEILDPKHEPKPLVEGFAQERITENLNRGLAVAPSRDGKSVYLSWRLLASDAPATAFHVYREVGGKACRLTKKAVPVLVTLWTPLLMHKPSIGWKLLQKDRSRLYRKNGRSCYPI